MMTQSASDVFLPASPADLSVADDKIYFAVRIGIVCHRHLSLDQSKRNVKLHTDEMKGIFYVEEHVILIICLNLSSCFFFLDDSGVAPGSEGQPC